MNPLCCIAPVSIEKDRAVVKQQTVSQELGFDNKNVNDLNDNAILRPVCFNSRRSFSAGNDVSLSNAADLRLSEKEKCEENNEVRDSKSVVGILYKWVNYGKGWRARWFVLEDGVLSYYKVHGPDKIVMSPGRDKGARVIGEESWRYMRKTSSGNGSGHGYRGNGFSSERQWKPFGEIHLKLCTTKMVKKSYDIGIFNMHISMEVFMMRQKNEGFLFWPAYFIAVSGIFQCVPFCGILIRLGLIGSSEEAYGLKSIMREQYVTRNFFSENWETWDEKLKTIRF